MVVHYCIDVVTNVVVDDCYVVWLFTKILVFVWSFIPVVSCIVGVTKIFLMVSRLPSIGSTKSSLRLIWLPAIVLETFLRVIVLLVF